MSFFDKLRQQAATPIRRIVTFFVRPDRKTGEDIGLPLEGHETTLSKEGSPDTMHFRYAQFYDCGHSMTLPLAGRCFACGSLSCTACHGSCTHCQKPLCQECSRYFEEEQSARLLRLCCPCDEKSRRRRLVRRLALGVVRPFVDFDRSKQR